MACGNKSWLLSSKPLPHAAPVPVKGEAVQFIQLVFLKVFPDYLGQEKA
jgi:hypothetical protein